MHSSLVSFEALTTCDSHSTCQVYELAPLHWPCLSAVSTWGVGNLDMLMNVIRLGACSAHRVVHRDFLLLSVFFSAHSNLVPSDLSKNLSFQPRIILTENSLGHSGCIQLMIPMNFESLILCLFSSLRFVRNLWHCGLGVYLIVLRLSAPWEQGHCLVC